MMRANERPRLTTEAAVNNVGTTHSQSTLSVRLGASPIDRQPEPIALTDALARLAAMLPRLAEAIQKADSRPSIGRMTLRLDELADALGVSRRVIERERAAGRLPKPDLRIGKMPLWRIETVRNWLERGSP